MINVEYLLDNCEGERLWMGRDARQACAPGVGRHEQNCFIKELSKFLEAYGTTSKSAWESGDFHFNPDPDPELPCFVQIVFNVWPKGLLRKVAKFSWDYTIRTGNQFYVHVDYHQLLISVLADKIIVYVIPIAGKECAARRDIQVGLADD